MTLAGVLHMLLRDGRMPASRCGSATVAALRPLLEAGALERRRKGGGSELVVADPGALRRFAERLFPAGLEAALDGAGSRAEGVTRFRDSKRAALAERPIVLLRGRPGTMVSSDAGPPLPLGALTAAWGAAALVLPPAGSMRFDGPLAVIENKAVFLAFETLVERGLTADMALWSGGRLDQRVIDWLAGLTGPLLHAGDWDASGLDDYARLKAACGARTRLFLPPDLDDLFARYAAPALGVTNPAIRARLAALGDPDLDRVLELIARHGAGLEQECLLG